MLYLRCVNALLKGYNRKTPYSESYLYRRQYCLDLPSSFQVALPLLVDEAYSNLPWLPTHRGVHQKYSLYDNFKRAVEVTIFWQENNLNLSCCEIFVTSRYMLTIMSRAAKVIIWLKIHQSPKMLKVIFKGYMEIFCIK